MVSADGTTTDPAKIESVTNWPIPKNVRQVRSFIGLCSYHRRYVRNFADIARPLHKLTEKNVKFEWTDSCQESFDTLKRELTTAPILGYPTCEDKFIIDCDASNDGMGGVLSQVQNGTEKVICYFSKAFTKPERRYCVTRRELLAVVASIRHFHHYLYARHFLVRSDHGALRWLFKFKNPEGQIARWLETLATYDFNIEHRAERIHSNADALSRRLCCESGCQYCLRAESRFDNSCQIDTNNRGNQSVCVVTRSQAKSGSSTESNDDEHFEDDKSLFNEQIRDPLIGRLITWKLDNDRPDWQNISAESTELKYYWSRFDPLEIKNDILYHKFENDVGDKITWQIAMPTKLRNTVLKQLHDVPTAGHLGVKKL